MDLDRYLDQYSDEELLKEAESFYENIRYPVSQSQMSGLTAHLNEIEGTSGLLKYIRHQKDKRDREINKANKSKRMVGVDEFFRYWRRLEDKIKDLRPKAGVIAKKFSAPDKKPKNSEAIYFCLCKEFLQHLAAHHRYFMAERPNKRP